MLLAQVIELALIAILVLAVLLALFGIHVRVTDLQHDLISAERRRAEEKDQQAMPDVTHPCPVRNCGLPVPYQKLMCTSHWHMVPKTMQDAVYGTWDHQRGAGSHAHAAAIEAAIDAVNKQVAS